MTAEGAVGHLAATSAPGLRTLRSSRFRMILAITLVVIGFAMQGLYFSLLASYGYGHGHDFVAYYLASQRLSEGVLPYTAQQLDGTVGATCVGCYLYPPFLAQWLTPLAQLSEGVATSLWYLIQLTAAWTAVWIGTGIGGARRSPERALWCLVAVVLFMPVFLSLFYGNVSAVLALGITLVATGGAVAGIAGAALTLIKVVPATLLPAAFLMGREPRRTLLVSLPVMLLIGFLLAPDAWLEYPKAFASLLAGSAQDPLNHAPSNLAAWAGMPDGLVTVIRVMSLGLGVAALVGSMWLARQAGGAPAAALMGTIAMLLVPATIWFHYFAVLLPFAAMAWPRAGSGVRIGLLLAAVALIPGAVMPAVAFLGATTMAAIAAWSLWPRGRATGPSTMAVPAT